MQKVWPDTEITWIIGKVEAKLLGDISGIRFLVYDKGNERASHAALREAIKGKPFDVVLHMQAALRASLICRKLRAPVKVGYDRIRARDFQWLFSTHRIPATGEQHVQDTLFEFLRLLGVTERVQDWSIPVSDADRAFVDSHVPSDRPIAVISPCSSHALRNWRTEYYAAAADHASSIGYQVVLAGGPSDFERQFADDIRMQMSAPAIDLVGKDTLKQLLVLLERAAFLISPDSGPAHMANAVGTPVIGLYAASNPRRTGPFDSIEWCVDRYAEAARQFLGKPPEAIRWGTKIEYEGVMDLIRPEDVIEKMNQLAAQLRG